MKKKLYFILGCICTLTFIQSKAQTAYTYPTGTGAAENFSSIASATPTAFGTTVPGIGTTSTHTLATSGTWTVDGAYGSSANGNPTQCIRLNRNNVNAGTNNINGSLITPKLTSGATNLTFDYRLTATGGTYPKTISVYKIVNGVEDPLSIGSFTWTAAPSTLTYATLTVPVNIDYVGLGLTDFKLNIKNTSATAGSGNNDILIDNVLITAYQVVPILNVTGTIAAFTQTGISNPTVAQSYFLSGTNLTSNVDVTAPLNFQVSRDSIAWVSTFNIAQTGGTLTGQPIKVFVRANGATTGPISGSVTNVSTGALTVNVPVSGQVVPAYYLKTGSVDPSSLTSYTSNPTGGSGTEPLNFTDESVFILSNNINLNLSADLTLGPLAKLVVGNGVDTAAFTIGVGRTFTGRIDVLAKASCTVNGTIVNNTTTNSGSIYGNLIVNGSHNLTTNGAVVFALSGTPVISYSPSSTINVTGPTTTVSVFQNYSLVSLPVGNVVWNATAQTTSASFISGTGNATLNVLGNFTITSTGTAHIFNGNGAGGRLVNITGNLIMNGGEYRICGLNTTPSSNSSSSTTTVTGNVTINAGTLVISASSGTGKGILSVKGNIVNNGTITNTSTNATFANGNRGIIELSGTGAQSITTSTDFAAGTAGRVILKLNNTGDATLLSAITVDSLQIVKGKLLLGNANLTLGLENAVLDTASTIGYLVTNGTGSLIVPVATQTSHFLPLGNSTNAKPATITFATTPTTPGTLSAKYDANFAAETLPTEIAVAGVTPNVDRVDAGQWQIDNTGIAFGTYTITVTNNGSTSIVAGQLANTTLLKRPNGGAWVSEGTHVTTTGSEAAPVLSRSGLTSFSQFAIAGKLNTVLPIALQQFNGKVANSGNQLTWIVNATSSVRIDLERSNTTSGFTKLHSVQANKLGQSFSYFDATLISSDNYYRLKFTNENNVVTYSSTLLLKSNDKKATAVLLYPTIVSSMATVEFKTEKAANISLSIIDMCGKLLLQKNMTLTEGTTQSQINVSNLVSGSYQLIIRNSEGVINTLRFIKQ